MNTLVWKRLPGLALLLCLSGQASAFTVGGMVLDEKIQVNKTNLVLNGAGVRSKVIINVYVGALYLRAKKTTADAVLADTGTKRVSLRILRHLSAGDFMDAFNKAINANHTPEEYAPLAGRLIRFGRVFRDVGEVERGAVIDIDYMPETHETVLTVNGKERTRVQGADFYTAMLKIWLGKNPVQESLKRAMLGG